MQQNLHKAQHTAANTTPHSARRNMHSLGVHE
jgi:hypothetical protein